MKIQVHECDNMIIKCIEIGIREANLHPSQSNPFY